MRRRAILLAAVLGLTPGLAQAHLVVSGMGPLYDGLVHFGLTPEDYLPLVALGFFAGLRGPRTSRWLLGALPLGWIAGGLAAMAGLAGSPVALSAAAAVSFLAVGGLLAANVDLPFAPCLSAGFALGLFRGLADLAGAALSAGHVASLIGMTAGVFTVFAIAASITLRLTRPWMIIAVRVSGSWLAASGLLLAGWVLRYGAKIT